MKPITAVILNTSVSLCLALLKLRNVRKLLLLPNLRLKAPSIWSIRFAVFNQCTLHLLPRRLMFPGGPWDFLVNNLCIALSFGILDRSSPGQCSRWGRWPSLRTATQVFLPFGRWRLMGASAITIFPALLKVLVRSLFVSGTRERRGGESFRRHAKKNWARRRRWLEWRVGRIRDCALCWRVEAQFLDYAVRYGKLERGREI